MSAASDDRIDLLMRFSSHMRAALRQNGYTDGPVATVREFNSQTGLNITTQTFSNWLNSVQVPNQKNLLVVAKWLGTTPQALTEGTPLLSFAPVKRADAESARVLDQYHRLNPYGRKVITAMLDSLVRLQGVPA